MLILLQCFLSMTYDDYVQKIEEIQEIVYHTKDLHIHHDVSLLAKIKMTHSGAMCPMESSFLKQQSYSLESCFLEQLVKMM